MTRKRKQNLFIDRRRVENVYAKITRLGARIVVLVFVAFSWTYLLLLNQAQKRPIQNQFRDAYRRSIVQRQWPPPLQACQDLQAGDQYIFWPALAKQLMCWKTLFRPRRPFHMIMSQAPTPTSKLAQFSDCKQTVAQSLFDKSHPLSIISLRSLTSEAHLSCSGFKYKSN
jgi:hypothetical protein